MFRPSMPCEDHCNEEIQFSWTGSSISCPKSHWKSVEDEGACFLIFLELQPSVLTGTSFSAQTFSVTALNLSCKYCQLLSLVLVQTFCQRWLGWDHQLIPEGHWTATAFDFYWPGPDSVWWPRAKGLSISLLIPWASQFLPPSQCFLKC